MCCLWHHWTCVRSTLRRGMTPIKRAPRPGQEERRHSASCVVRLVFLSGLQGVGKGGAGASCHLLWIPAEAGVEKWKNPMGVFFFNIRGKPSNDLFLRTPIESCSPTPTPPNDPHGPVCWPENWHVKPLFTHNHTSVQLQPGLASQPRSSRMRCY